MADELALVVSKLPRFLRRRAKPRYHAAAQAAPLTAEQADRAAAVMIGLPPEMDRQALVDFMVSKQSAEPSAFTLEAMRGIVDALFISKGSPRTLLTIVAITGVKDPMDAYIDAMNEALGVNQPKRQA